MIKFHHKDVAIGYTFGLDLDTVIEQMEEALEILKQRK